MTQKLIAIDWGTSSFRAWLLGTEGKVMEEIPSGPGILSASEGDFDAAFEAAIGHWLSLYPDLPVIASGMITSRNGWVETPYLPLPLDAQDLAASLTTQITKHGRRVSFVTGAVRNPDCGLPDIMRGEETEIIGHLADSEVTDGMFVLPGTHSKWARVEDRRLMSFNTCMTGEVFAILREHSILGRLIRDSPFNADAFMRGLESGRADGALLSRIFSARSLALMDRLAADEVTDYLSGLLIGDEVAGALATTQGAVTIIGRGDLAERYRIALEHAGAEAVLAAPGMARAGLWNIAKLAGVIG